MYRFCRFPLHVAPIMYRNVQKMHMTRKKSQKYLHNPLMWIIFVVPKENNNTQTNTSHET